MSNKFWFIWVFCLVLLAVIFSFTAIKQSENREKFMVACLADKKQYECDILWPQTDKANDLRDLAIGMAIGAAIGATFKK